MTSGPSLNSRRSARGPSTSAAKLLVLISLLLHGAAAPSGAACPIIKQGRRVGTVPASALSELSGVAAARRTTGILWTHNDSGDSARVFAITTAGALRGTYTLSGANATDWEDIAIGPGPEAAKTYLYVGDTGDNNSERSSITVYRVEEPAVPLTGGAVNQTLTGVTAINLVYPGGAKRDAETLLSDPTNGDLYLVTRDRGGEGFARVFRKPAPHSSGSATTLTQVTTLAGVPDMLVKGGDISPDGRLIALRHHRSDNGNGQVRLWRRADGTTIADALAQSPCSIDTLNEPQGEALGFAADGTGFYTLTEGTNSPINFYPRIADEYPSGWTAR